MASRAAHPFEHATTHVVGGVAPDQVDLIFADLTAVQQMLSAADPQTSNLCDLHTQHHQSAHRGICLGPCCELANCHANSAGE
jgi:hypothetical protein